MKTALFIGGTGLISTAVSKLAIERGWDLTLLIAANTSTASPKGRTSSPWTSTTTRPCAAPWRGSTTDVIAQWIAFKPERVQRDIDLFLGKCDQYILISSAAAYERPMRTWRITESLSLNNRYWQYGRDKRACEATALAAYREKEFPVTIVRPSLTYGDTQIPFAMGSWSKPWSLVQRMLDGKEIVVHGRRNQPVDHDPQHDFAKGFVGLMGRRQAIGEAYHITSDEVLTWDEIAIANRRGRGRRAQDGALHRPADRALHAGGGRATCSATSPPARCLTTARSRALVPDFVCTVPFRQGVQRSVDYFLAHPDLQVVDEDWNRKIDAIIAADRAFHP